MSNMDKPPMTQDVQTLRRQLQQLGELHQGGVLDATAYDDGKAALERKLVELVMSGAPLAGTPSATAATDPGPRPSRRLVAALATAVALLAVAGYAWNGSPRLAAMGSTSTQAGTGGEAGPNSGHPMGIEQIADMADKLARRLEDRPGDAEGWAMLARSYNVLGRAVEAIPAYEKAVALRGDDATLLADYADALAVKNGGRLAGEPMKLIERALALDPGNLKALSLAGTEAFDRKDYAAARRHWGDVIRLGPGDSPLVQQATSALAEAQDLDGPRPSVASTASASAAGGGASVSGSVAIAPALAGRAGPDDTVFVFARAAEGPRMPLAVLRKQVKDLPFDFRLDDSMAMAGTARLSSAARLVVGVRISKRGDAVPAAGDLVGQSGPIGPGASGIKVEVGEVVGEPGQRGPGS